MCMKIAPGDSVRRERPAINRRATKQRPVNRASSPVHGAPRCSPDVHVRAGLDGDQCPAIAPGDQSPGKTTITNTEVPMRALIVLLICALTLSACAPAATPAPTPTATVTAQPTATATATPTATLAPTVTPTPTATPTETPTPTSTPVPALIGAELLPGQYRLGATEEEWRQVLEAVNDSVDNPDGAGKINRFERADLSQTLIMNIQGKTIAIFVEKGVRVDPVVYVDQFEALLKRFLSPGFFDDDKINTYLLMFSKVVGAETYNLGGQGTAFPYAMGPDGRTKIDGVRVAIMTETADVPEIYNATFAKTPPELKSRASTYSYILRIIDMLEMVSRGCSSLSECKEIIRNMPSHTTTALYSSLRTEGNLHPDGSLSYPVWLTPYRY